MAAVAADCCCWSTASGDAEGDDEVEDAAEAADEGGEPDEGVDEDEDDVEEDVTSDEDKVFAVGGKICTISIGACLCCCSSDLLVGEFSGVLVTNVTVEQPGGRALSIALNSLSGTVVLPIAVLLLWLLLLLILLLETFKAPSVLLVVLLTDSSYSSDEDGVDSEDEDWIGKGFRDGSAGKSVAACAVTGARDGCCCCRWICSGVRSATNGTVLASE